MISMDQARKLMQVLSNWPDRLTCNVYVRRRKNPYTEEVETRYDPLGWLASQAGVSDYDLKHLERVCISRRSHYLSRDLKKGILIDRLGPVKKQLCEAYGFDDSTLVQLQYLNDVRGWWRHPRRLKEWLEAWLRSQVWGSDTIERSKREWGWDRFVSEHGENVANQV